MTPTASTIAYWVGRPNTHGDNFFGRQLDLDALDSAFADSRVVVVSGGAGVGKSQLVAEYSHSAGRDGFWTAAGGKHRTNADQPCTAPGGRTE